MCVLIKNENYNKLCFITILFLKILKEVEEVIAKVLDINFCSS